MRASHKRSRGRLGESLDDSGKCDFVRWVSVVLRGPMLDSHCLRRCRCPSCRSDACSQLPAATAQGRHLVRRVRTRSRGRAPSAITGRSKRPPRGASISTSTAQNVIFLIPTRYQTSESRQRYPLAKVRESARGGGIYHPTLVIEDRGGSGSTTSWVHVASREGAHRDSYEQVSALYQHCNISILSTSFVASTLQIRLLKAQTKGPN
ncbi:hypothetical protein OBBRIDRAFT_625411 [Obba rivulosa]|uniref:Uncharacterized protein n=1 Tax=Obba rivulosa TaxID=1052685 RepID=A0A8E2B2N3_9APHY|nr:hypothetical protein OBBRIDRAFT_625411 [Obba rivulosa]